MYLTKLNTLARSEAPLSENTNAPNIGATAVTWRHNRRNVTTFYL